MSLVNQFSIQIENERGSLAELCSELAKVAVNITGIQVPESRARGYVRIVAHPQEAAKKVLDQLGCKYREEKVVAAHLPERPGALGKLTRKLAEKGIDILYCYGTIERNSERAVVILGVSDPEAADKFIK